MLPGSVTYSVVRTCSERRCDVKPQFQHDLIFLLISIAISRLLANHDVVYRYRISLKFLVHSFASARLGESEPRRVGFAAATLLHC